MRVLPPPISIVGSLEDAAEYLAGHPRAGHTRKDLDDKSLLAWVVWPYVIVYKLEQPDVKVIRVLHGHRDIGTIMGNA